MPLHACIPPSEFGGRWPDGVPVQIHTDSCLPDYDERAATRVEERALAFLDRV